MQTSSGSLRLLVRIFASRVSLHRQIWSGVDAGNISLHRNGSLHFLRNDVNAAHLSSQAPGYDHPFSIGTPAMSIEEPCSRELPLITIGVTTYDRPELLKECIGSILAQTYQNFEIIIGNDFVQGPVSFESLSINPDKRIQIINYRENIGAYKNNYYLLSVARGDWFTWLADDDLMHPEFLQATVSVLAKHDVSSVYTNYVAAPKPQGVFPRSITHKEPIILCGTEFVDMYTSRQIRTIGSYGLLKRSILGQVASAPRFGAGRPVYVDTFIPILAASLGDIAYIDEDLVFLRTHQASGSASESCLRTYSSAQVDFLLEFKRLREAVTPASKYQLQVENLLRWFALDGWAVICRRHGGMLTRLSHFFNYTLATLMAPLRWHRRVGFFMCQMKNSILDSARVMASRLLGRR